MATTLLYIYLTNILCFILGFFSLRSSQCLITEKSQNIHPPPAKELHALSPADFIIDSLCC